MANLEISICPFTNGEFDVMFRDVATGEEVIFSGSKKLDERQFEFVNRIAPSCVWTEYQRITPED